MRKEINRTVKHTLEEVRSVYDGLDKLCGVDTSNVKLRVSSRTVSRLGSCAYRISSDGIVVPKQIFIAEFVLDNDELYENTIRHEYAHALIMLRYPGERHGHDQVWKSVCAEVGCVPERTDKREEALRICQEQRRNLARYKVVCVGCGAEWYYRRETKVIKNLKARRKIAGICSQCGGNNLLLEERITK